MKQDWDNILSFDQGAGFYLKTGRRQAEAGNLVTPPTPQTIWTSWTIRRR